MTKVRWMFSWEALFHGLWYLKKAAPAWLVEKKCSSRSIQPWSDNAHSLEPFWSAYYSPSLLKRYHTAKTISERNNKWFGCRTGVLPSSWNCYTCHTWNLILRSIFQRLCLCLFQKCHQKRVWCCWRCVVKNSGNTNNYLSKMKPALLYGWRFQHKRHWFIIYILGHFPILFIRSEELGPPRPSSV